MYFVNFSNNFSVIQFDLKWQRLENEYKIILIYQVNHIQISNYFCRFLSGHNTFNFFFFYIFNGSYLL